MRDRSTDMGGEGGLTVARVVLSDWHNRLGGSAWNGSGGGVGDGGSSPVAPGRSGGGGPVTPIMNGRRR